MPLISVTMPAYNTRESYLRAAIESILRRAYCARVLPITSLSS